MQKQIITCVNLGMTRDVGISQLSEKQANYAFENHNIRITAVNDNTLYTVTNEKGTKFETSIIGIFLGSCVLKNYIVIFTKDTTTQTDYIYRLEYNISTDSIDSSILYKGQLDFNLEYPIEAIGYYESKEIQKVYWVDGINTNRFINIANDKNGNIPNYNSGNKYQFDFLGHINSFPEISITKKYDVAGTFLAGTILYFATYYNKYGIETCIVWQSDLQYISAYDRGAKPDESVSCAFNFTISNLDTSYDYIRIYAAYRAGLNSTAEGRIVTELEISDTNVQFTDLGTEYQNYNAEDIHYLGGQNIIANTIDYKQDTLFLGNIQLKQDGDISILKNLFRENCINKSYEGIEICECPFIEWKYKKISDNKNDINKYHQQINNSQSLIAGFKYRELYRFGIQFMDNLGEWTSAIWIGDKYCNLPPSNVLEIPEETTHYGITFYYQLELKVKGLFYKVFNGTDGYLDGYYLKIDLGGDNVHFYTTGSAWRDLKEIEYTREESLSFFNSLTILTYYNSKEEFDVNDERHIQAEDIVIKEGSLNEGIFIALATLTLPTFIYAHLNGYVAYRLLVAETSIESRRIITLGVINPTMFNYKERENNQPFSINSWVFRPRQANITNRHYDMLHTLESEYAEIQGVMKRRLPGYSEKDLTDSGLNKDGFILIFAPKYLAGCRLWYKLIYFNTNSCSLNFPFIQSNYASFLNEKSLNNLSTKELKGREAAIAIAKSNQCLKDGTKMEDIIPYNFSEYEIVSLGLIKKTSWEKILAEVISKITKDIKSKGYDIVISDSMLPSKEQYKQAAFANEVGSSSNIGAFIGLGVALAASVIASIFTFGAAAAPALAATATTLATLSLASIGSTIGLAAAGAAAVLAAIGSSAAIATIADQVKYNEDLKDIDKTLSYKGIYSILNDHKLLTRQIGDKVANNLLSKMFENWEDDDPFTSDPNNNSLGEHSNYYVMGGRLSLLDDKEKDKNSKLDAYYIDESIVTLNSPNIDIISLNVNDSLAYKLDLIGTIPIESIATDYIMYAEQGLANTSLPITGLNKSTIFGKADHVNYGESDDRIVEYEGLYNGFLYLDSSFPKENFDPTAEGAYIQATANVSGYKTYMWNRNTSWSLWAPGITIKDVYGNSLTTPPAKPIKKIFANIKYSKNTIYLNNIYSIEIDPLKVITSDLPSLSLFLYNGDDRYYYGNIDTVILPSENYTLIDDSNSEFIKNEDGIVQIPLKDPVPLRYKSTPHILVPFKWSTKDNTSLLLPVTELENELFPWDMYKSYYGTDKEEINKNKRLINILGAGTSVFIPPSIEDGWTDIHYFYELENKITYSPFVDQSQLFNLLEGDKLSSFLMLYILFGAATLERQKYMSDLWYDNYLNYVTEDNWENFLKLGPINNWMLDFEYGISLFYLEDAGSRCGYIIESTQDGWKLKRKIDYGQGDLPNTENKSIPLIAPIISTSTEKLYPWSTEVKYKKLIITSEGSIIIEDREKDEGATLGYYTNGGWTLEKINWDISSAYLFLGELVRKDFDYNNWYNGNTDYSLQQLNWNICSAITPITSNIENTWGDTYYQRWECLKTYPFSELEVNSNVEVLSFMLESYINLDGRSDTNRRDSNLLNLRPSNTNLFNLVYSLQDNFFSYKVLDEKFDKNIFENQVVWSLSKSNLDNIDKWTNIHAINTLLLDGKLGSINKIINMNDTLLVFQDTGISTIDYNLKSALTTYEGVPLQMGNTGKVTGYTRITSDIGCHNKWAICLTEAGIFFIDSYKKALYVIAPNVAPTNISSTKYFSTWFKENIDNSVWNPNTNIQAFRLNYDSNTKDLYISNNNTCLLYNTEMQMFTSFMDYINTPLLINVNGKSIAFALGKKNNFIHGDPEIKVWSLFEGDYNDIYGFKRNYSIEYRLNPSPYTDNMFTNYLYIADWTSDNLNSFLSKSKHFDIVKAWNEYLSGELSANTGVGIQPLKTKFRIWRGDIPRDGDTKTKRVLKGDRMRNPWIHLKFTKDNIDNTKMTFHNLNVIYYN